MASLARDFGDSALLAFVRQLVADNSLDGEAQVAARKLLEAGEKALAAEEIVVLEQEVIAPYVGECEACHGTPAWAEMLHVYDTGLCADCFDKLEGVETPAVRPDWMPMAKPPTEHEDISVEAEETAPVTAAVVSEPLGA